MRRARLTIEARVGSVSLDGARLGGCVDFTFTPDDERFRADLRTFLHAQLPDRWADRDFLSDVSPDERNEVESTICRTLGERRWLAPGWAERLGGMGASPMQQAIALDETAYAAMPGALNAGVQSVGPAIEAFGSAAQRAAVLPRIASGEDMWCVLFSEPNAGADLSAMQTSAVRDGDEYVINGTKVWASGADRASHSWLAARSDPATSEDARQHGLSTFLVPMDTPGISVRPIVDMNGDRDLSEVTFEDARIPTTSLVGAEGSGWAQITAALEAPRSGIEAYASGRAHLERLVAAMRDEASLMHRSTNARYEIADRWIELEVGTQLAYLVPHLQSHGAHPVRESQESRLYGAELTQRIANTGMHLLGMASQVTPGSPYARLGGAFARLYTRASAATVAGGPSEMRRTLIAQRGLGLPRS